MQIHACVFVGWGGGSRGKPVLLPDPCFLLCAFLLVGEGVNKVTKVLVYG